MNYKIVSDSSSNLQTFADAPFSSVPLHIIIGNQSFVDDASLNIQEMYHALCEHKGTTSTSCPSPDDWMQAFEDADVIFCVTITSGLSGSYASAHTAKQLYEEQHPDKHVYLVDSLSTGPEMVLLIEKIASLMKQGTDPEQVYEQVDAYHKKTHLYYSLASLDNLAKNGRISPIIAKGVGALGIRIIGTTSKEGTLKPVNKARGDKRAMKKIVDYMKTNGYHGGRVIISHSENAEAVEILQTLLAEEFGKCDCFVHENTGLCGYYAELKSVMVGFET